MATAALACGAQVKIAVIASATGPVSVLGIQHNSITALLPKQIGNLGSPGRLPGDILNVIAELRASGISLLPVEQISRAQLRIADYAYVVESGGVAWDGPVANIAKHAYVVSPYPGVRSAN